jgi:hypothetical protein
VGEAARAIAGRAAGRWRAGVVAGGRGLHVPLVDSVPPVRGKVGRPKRRPVRMTADRGYNHDKYRRELRSRGITPEIATPPDRTRLGTWPCPLGGRAHLRMAPQLQAAARPLRPPARDPPGVPLDRLLPRLLQATGEGMLIRLLSPGNEAFLCPCLAPDLADRISRRGGASDMPRLRERCD